ncbi:MAG: ATP-dependent RecD-like DNA helicase [Planctomycetota bacterium]|nr:ATP-dependent RecD-like DNA helicase [Planctomycetota bacterium]
MNTTSGNEHESLEGEVLSVIFQSEDSGFAVISLKSDNDVVTVAGEFAPVNGGEYLKLHGKWGDHPKYGKQFKASWSEKTSPTTLDGLKKYLSSGAFEGVGPDMASRIVNHFGDSTLKALEGGSKTLQAVDGIGPKRAATLADLFKEGRDRHRVMAEMRGFGLSASQSTALYEMFGADAINKIQSDPYGLVWWVRGIGFTTADRIAIQIGIEEDSAVRAAGICSHLLHEAKSEGHCCLPQNIVIDSLERSGLSEASIVGGVKSAIENHRVILEAASGDDGEPYFYLPDLLDCEISIAGDIKRLQSCENKLRVSASDIESAIRQTEFPPDDSQRRALEMALTERFSVITGGPGTGKTTTMRLLLEVLHTAGVQNILLASPTGRAAKRLAEATGHEASTIHRLLKFDPISGQFAMNRDDPLDADYVIIDEVSMMDLKLCASLLRAMPDSAQVLLVGDADQLPSVGAGAILRDFVAANCVATSRLERIHRQGQGSGIVEAAHAVLNGEIPSTVTSENGIGDFFVSFQEDNAVATDVLQRVVTERIPDKYGIDTDNDLLVLSPMYRGGFGVNELNDRLSHALNPKGNGPTWARGLRVGDKVMVTRNDYEREIFNGDTGTVINISDSELTLEIGDYHHYYSADDLSDLIPAYCVTVHRAQGSEAKAVVIALSNSHFPMLRRNLLYTAITRGKDLVVLITSKYALRQAIANNEESKRHCRLLHKLESAVG